MTCIWRIHGSKPYILVYNTSVFCFSHFHLEGVGGWSEPNETNFIWKKLSHFETIPKYKKILRQCSILAVNFWSVTYFGVIKFGTSYLGAKIDQNKTMTKISRFTGRQKEHLNRNTCYNYHDKEWIPRHSY